MRIKDVRLSILRTERGQKVIPTQGAVDKLPQLVLFIAGPTKSGLGYDIDHDAVDNLTLQRL